MPYINDREGRRELVEPLSAEAANAGELNFQVTCLVRDYLRIHGLSYQTCNDIVGALDNAKDEFKRRIQNPYEDRKIEENGDVYE
jgi:hypothetical protein